jgi:hypothetical protein
VPQVWTIWVNGNAKGGPCCRGARTSCPPAFGFFYGLQKGDKTIYLACVGWVVLDGVVAGALLRG